MTPMPSAMELSDVSDVSANGNTVRRSLPVIGEWRMAACALPPALALATASCGSLSPHHHHHHL